MASPTPYDKQSPIFNFDDKNNGVLFPFVMNSTEADASNLGNNIIDLDGADTSTILASFVAPFDCELITVQAYAAADDQGLKAGAATTEPILGLVYGSNQLVTGAAGTSLNLITCSGAGLAGKIWSGVGTNQTSLTQGQEVGVYLQTAAADSETCNLIDGGARVVLWVAIANSPA